MAGTTFRYGRLVDRCRQFCADSRGMSLPMIALVLVPVLGFIGLSVDAGRGYMVKSRLGDALDAAALAGAQVVHDQAKFDQDVDMFFYANFPKGFLGADPVLIKPAVDANTPTITLSATATVNTTFTRFLGYETMTVGSSTEVTRLTSSMDVVIAVDMSGSMGNDGKLIAAKDAAKDLVDILFGAESTKSFLQIGLVPWNSKVNVTINNDAFINHTFDSVSGFYKANNSPVPLKVAPPDGWRGCVYSRYSANGVDDDADDRFAAATVNGVTWDAWLPIDFDVEPSSSTVCEHNGSEWECPCNQNGITRLTNVKNDVESAITQLDEPEGGTNIAAGLAWAWRTLMPAEPFTQGVLVPKGRHTRAIVLLTDGRQEGGYGDSYNFAFDDGKPSAGLNARLEKVADAVKAQGVEVYAIQYDANFTDLNELMQRVATGPAAPYWHSASSSTQLKEIFQEVANHLSELRLSK